MPGIKKKLTLAQTVLNFSESYFISRFNATNIKSQVAKEYHIDPNKLVILKKELAAKLVVLRDACSDLTIEKNRKTVINFMAYFNGSDVRNAQFRGLQSQLANEIYEKVVTASGIDLTPYNNELSAEAFSNEIPLNTKHLTYVPRVTFPSVFSEANSQSFKHGHELVITKVHSSLSGFHNTMNEDKPVVYNNITKPIYKNHNQTNNDFDSDTDTSIVKNDIKTLSLPNVNNNTGNIISVGAAAESLVTQKTQFLGAIALNSYALSQIKHVDPSKNNKQEKLQILNDIVKTGIGNTNLTGITILIDSRYTSD